MPPEAQALAVRVAQQTCSGLNECKGLSCCKSDSHSCAGLNDCKGQGACACSNKNLAIKLVEKHMAEKRAKMQTPNLLSPEKATLIPKAPTK